MIEGNGVGAVHGRWAVPAVLFTVLLALGGCTVGPSDRPPVAVRGESTAPRPAPPSAPTDPDALPPLTPQDSTIRFTDCTDGAFSTLGLPVPTDRSLAVECGEVPVPADPDRPDSGAVLLGVVRVGPAGTTLDRPPLLVVGDSATDASTRRAVALAAQVSPAVLEQFTIVGLDRRGAGLDRIDCAPPEARAALVDADPAALAEPDLFALLEQARAVVQQCNRDATAVSSYRSGATAGDVEILRSRLGVPQLSAIGVGDGAGALATWAATAPGGVARLVLDGPPDPVADEPARATARAVAADAALAALATSCTAGGSCALGPDPQAAVLALVTRLGAQPQVAADGRRLTAGSAVTAVLDGLGEPDGWPALTAALAASDAGDPTPLLDRLDALTGPTGTYAAELATDCNDTTTRLAPAEISAAAQRLRTDHPLFGGTLGLRMLACAPWPAGTTGAPPAAPGALPPVLVIGTAADPRAPLDGSRRVADGLLDGRFVSWQGAGTGAYPRTPCVVAAVESVLVTGRAPASGTVCPP